MPFDHVAYREEFCLSPTPINDAEKYGVKIVPGSTAPGENEYVYRIIGVHHLTAQENDNRHNLIVDVLDEDGLPLRYNDIAWTWEGRRPDEPAPPLKLDKPDDEPAGSLPIWWGQTISAWVDDVDLEYDDKIVGISTAHPDEPPGNHTGHHSFYVVWQLVRPDDLPTPEPAPAPTSAEILLRQIHEMINGYFADKSD